MDPTRRTRVDFNLFLIFFPQNSSEPEVSEESIKRTRVFSRAKPKRDF